MRFQTKRFTVDLFDNDPTRGFFEHDDYGMDAGGGLWFEIVSGVRHLYDYDGVFELPAEVIDGLRAHGVIVSEDFE